MSAARTWSFYDTATGALAPSALTCAAAQVAANTPPGHAAIEGRFDPLSQRVDLATGQVVDYQPPAPAADELRTWAWDEATRRWVAVPTLAALKLAARDRIKAAREAAISAPKLTSFGTFDATLEARSNIAAVVAMAQTAEKLGLPSSVSFTLADNTRPEFTLAQIESAALQVGAQVQAAYDHADELFQQIEAAADAAALASINW
jgi:Domain of unknown function (DUF4376)